MNSATNARSGKSSGENGLSPRRSLKWRVVDIAVASVIGVASGLIFWGLGALPFYNILEAVTPGLSGLINGFWIFAGPLALFIVRKPGAGLYAEILATFVEMVLGAQWSSISTLIPGIVQGICAEIVFAVVAYRLWTWWMATICGAVSSLGTWVYELFHKFSAIAPGGEYGVVFFITSLISGAVFAGICMWWVYRALAKTGVLDKFDSGSAVRYAR